MRYFVILLVFAGFIGTAYAVPPQDSERLYDTSDVIIFGKIVFANSTFSPTNTLYHVEVEKFHKNPQDDDVIFVVGPNTENPRLGNQVFDVGDKALLFLINRTEYDPYYSVHYHSFLVKPEWEECDIFSIDFPREHWIFGGRGPDPKVHQENSIDNHNFKLGKEVTLTYDIFNITPNQQTVHVGLTIFNRDDPDSAYVFRNTSTHSLEPCVPYRTLEWSFTPSKPGHYAAEFDNLMGSRITIGFTVKGSQSDSSDDSTTRSTLKLDDFASKLWYDHDIIIDGTILDISGYNQSERAYDIRINSFIKPTENTDTKLITVYGFPNFYTVEGDKGIFFIKKQDAKWTFGEYGAKTTLRCPPERMYYSPALIDPPLTRGYHTPDFTYVDCAPHYYRKYLPEYMKFYGASVFSPLTQQIDGVPSSEVVCNEGLELAMKNNGYAACVKPETKQILIERGWAKLI